MFGQREKRKREKEQKRMFGQGEKKNKRMYK